MDDRLNFKEICALVVDSDRYSSRIIAQILKAFGLDQHLVVTTAADAKKQLGSGQYDLLITECMLPDLKAGDLIRWVRRSRKDSLRYMPIILLTGYTRYSNVTSARDAGVSSVVRKPVSANILFDHIAWSARTERPFIDADEYSGPCRRFRFGDAAPGLNRRMSDHSPDPAVPRPPEAQTKEEEASS